MHPIAERIIAGESVCDHEIWEYNSRKIIEREVKRKAAGEHPAKGCRVKNCDHNKGDDLPYAVELAERAVRDCTCGHYST